MPDIDPLGPIVSKDVPELVIIPFVKVKIPLTVVLLPRIKPPGLFKLTLPLNVTGVVPPNVCVEFPVKFTVIEADVENGALIVTFPRMLRGLLALLVNPIEPLNRISLTSPDNEDGLIVTPDLIVHVFTTLKVPPPPPPAAA